MSYLLFADSDPDGTDADGVGECRDLDIEAAQGEAIVVGCAGTDPDLESAVGGAVIRPECGSGSPMGGRTGAAISLLQSISTEAGDIISRLVSTRRSS